MAERIARENEERQKSEEEMAKRLKASQEVGIANYIFCEFVIRGYWLKIMKKKFKNLLLLIALTIKQLYATVFIHCVLYMKVKKVQSNCTGK